MFTYILLAKQQFIRNSTFLFYELNMFASLAWESDNLFVKQSSLQKSYE